MHTELVRVHDAHSAPHGLTDRAEYHFLHLQTEMKVRLLPAFCAHS